MSFHLQGLGGPSEHTMKLEDTTPPPEPIPPLHEPPRRRNTSFKGDVLRLVRRWFGAVMAERSRGLLARIAELAVLEELGVAWLAMLAAAPAGE